MSNKLNSDLYFNQCLKCTSSISILGIWLKGHVTGGMFIDFYWNIWNLKLFVLIRDSTFKCNNIAQTAVLYMVYGGAPVHALLQLNHLSITGKCEMNKALSSSQKQISFSWKTLYSISSWSSFNSAVSPTNKIPYTIHQLVSARGAGIWDLLWAEVIVLEKAWSSIMSDPSP